MFWKKKGINYNSPEFLAIEAGTAMVGQTVKRYRSPNQKRLSYSCPPIDGVPHCICCTSSKLLPAYCISSLRFRDIERVLRETVALSHTGRKPNFDDFLKLKFEGARYVNEDGILIDGVQVGRPESRMAQMSKDYAPLLTKGLARQGEQKRTEIQNDGLGLEDIPMHGCDSTKAVDIFPEDIFSDPSLFFSGPSRTGFTGIGGQSVSEGYYLPYDLSRFFFGGESEAFIASFHDRVERHEPEHA